MKKLVRNLVTVGLVGGLALFVSGCSFEEGKYTGGGWMDSALEDDVKANLGFNIQVSDEDGDGAPDTAKGQLQYKDRGGDGVSFHGVVTSGVVLGIAGEKIGVLAGTYTPQPKGEGGTFLATVYDEGEPGASEEDSVTITLDGGVHDGYSNEGVLQGGNVKYHEAK